MKKIIFLIFITASFAASSQIISPSDGNKFFYNGLADVSFQYAPRGSGGRAFVHDNYNVLSLNYGEDFTGGTRIGRDVYFKDGDKSFIYSGNFGIGTTTPLAKLEVSGGDLLVRNMNNIDNSSSIMIAHSINAGNLDTYGTSIRTITQNAGANIYGMQFFTQESYQKNQTEKVRILGNGNVGIGTVNPTNKLDVNGTIHSREVKVDMIGWSDFVFKKEHNLPKLEEVEKHIKEKGHLENIPSQKEVLENGINLGEMNAKLLQKIEELTLYSIEQNKEINLLKKENELLKLFSQRLAKIENELQQLKQ